MSALLSPDEARDAIGVPRAIVDPELDERLALLNAAAGLWFAEICDGEFLDEDDQFPPVEQVPADLKQAVKAYMGWVWGFQEGAPGDGVDFAPAQPFDVPRRIYNLIPGRYAPGIA